MQTVIFKLNPSRYLLRLIFILYSLLLISLVFSGCGDQIIILYILCALISFYLIYQKQQNYQFLVFHQKSGWKIVDHYSQAYYIKIRPNSFCSRFFMILNFVSDSENLKNKAHKISLVLLPDSMIKQDFKSLRIYLLNAL
jgi:hypothetical protein